MAPGRWKWIWNCPSKNRFIRSCVGSLSHARKSTRMLMNDKSVSKTLDNLEQRLNVSSVVLMGMKGIFLPINSLNRTTRFLQHSYLFVLEPSAYLTIRYHAQSFFKHTVWHWYQQMSFRLFQIFPVFKVFLPLSSLIWSSLSWSPLCLARSGWHLLSGWPNKICKYALSQSKNNIVGHGH